MVTSPDHQRHDDGRGMSHCREVVEETAGTRRGRSKPTATIERMTAGDTLVVYMPDRVARSVKELPVFLEDTLAPCGINLEISGFRQQWRKIQRLWSLHSRPGGPS
ncbi:recombinase family protein [Streptosporangium canum]|uniref:recombinase family protein n=1 Tax=Streptosporangium canum TaxID=324952 RepID=UPI00342A473B